MNELGTIARLVITKPPQNGDSRSWTDKIGYTTTTTSTGKTIGLLSRDIQELHYVPTNLSDLFWDRNWSESYLYWNTSTGENETIAASPMPPKDWMIAIISILCGVIIVGTIIGNLLVCIAVAVTRKLRTPSNLLIVSLAASDLLVATTVMPFAVIQEVKRGRWEFGQIVCDIWTSLDVTFCTASILNLCMISIDRYLAITRPFTYAIKRTPLRLAAMILLVWAMSAIISIPPMLGWKGVPQPYKCEISQDIGYQFYATIGAFYLPLLVMIVIYTRIFLVSSRLARHANSYRQASISTLTTSTTPTESSSNPSASLFSIAAKRRQSTPCNRSSVDSDTILTAAVARQRQGRSHSLGDMWTRFNCRIRSSRCRFSSDRKATRTLGVIMGAFTACWLPFFVLALVRPFCGENAIPHWLEVIFLWLGYTNSLLNPIIYARFNREFRTPFLYILQGRCREINACMRTTDFTKQFGRSEAFLAARPSINEGTLRLSMVRAAEDGLEAQPLRLHEDRIECNGKNGKHHVGNNSPNHGGDNSPNHVGNNSTNHVGNISPNYVGNNSPNLVGYNSSNHVGNDLSNLIGDNSPNHVGNNLPNHVGNNSPNHVGNNSPNHVGNISPNYVGNISPNYVGNNSPNLVGYNSSNHVGNDLSNLIGDNSPNHVGNNLPNHVGNNSPNHVGNNSPNHVTDDVTILVLDHKVKTGNGTTRSPSSNPVELPIDAGR